MHLVQKCVIQNMMNMVKLETKLLMYTLYSRQFDGSICETRQKLGQKWRQSNDNQTDNPYVTEPHLYTT